LIFGSVFDTGQAFDHEIVLSQSSSLVEAANVDLAGKWDPEGLSAEDLLLDQLDDAVVDGHR
jgi:hypothetical protein